MFGSVRMKKTGMFCLRWGITVLIALIVLVPLYWIVLSSFTPYSEIFKSPINYFPDYLTGENYAYLVEKVDLWGKAGNTLLITGAAILCSTVVCLMCAYAVAKFKYKIVSAAFTFLLGSSLIPIIVTARPMFDLMSKLGLVNTYQGLTMLYTSNLIPFTVLILSNFLGKLPPAIDEAAAVDGANQWQRIFHITMPLLRPAIATVCIINFINCLNELFTPLFFSLTIEPLSVAITTIPRRGMTNLLPWDLVSAMGCVILAPIVLFVVVFEKNIIEGIIAGGVKA